MERSLNNPASFIFEILSKKAACVVILSISDVTAVSTKVYTYPDWF